MAVADGAKSKQSLSTGAAGRSPHASLEFQKSDAPAVGFRHRWQTCAEFGYYQTCEEGSRCPFARGYVQVSDEISTCATAFGLDEGVVSENVAFTNAVYGSDAPKGTRILFPNGDVDPWSGLGVVNSPGAAEPVMMVKGASHHAWTHPADTISQPTVAAAKKQIQEQVMAWLQED